MAYDILFFKTELQPKRPAEGKADKQPPPKRQAKESKKNAGTVEKPKTYGLGMTNKVGFLCSFI